jgi:hypothetical protein
MINRSAYALIGGGAPREELEDLIDEMEDVEWDILSRYHPKRFDRRAVNRRLAALASRSSGRAS